MDTQTLKEKALGTNSRHQETWSQGQESRQLKMILTSEQQQTTTTIANELSNHEKT